MVKTLIATAALMLAASFPMEGTFALQSGTARTDAHMLATPLGTAHRQKLDVWFTRPGSADAVRAFDVDMTQVLHMIVISDDFAYFAHEHPALGSDGHFTIDQTFPRTGRYTVYVDGMPSGIGQQVFRFAVVDGDANAPAEVRTMTGGSSRVTVDGYTISLSTTYVAAKNTSPIAVHITKNGKPATDLHPYLGALAHAVFVNAGDLTYVHVHPAPLGSGMQMFGTSMPGMGDMKMPSLAPGAHSSPDMALDIELAERGTYKLWLQFRGGSKLVVAPFVVLAR